MPGMGGCQGVEDISVGTKCKLLVIHVLCTGNII